jgi:uncharacterized spore protein YtfJ
MDLMNSKNVERSIKAMENATNAVSDLFAAGDPEAVYSKPIQAGAYTIITAAEVGMGGGVGYGTGLDEPEEGESTVLQEGAQFSARFGGGAGGGGGSHGRPVAVITVGPEGVQVQPVLDYTKIGLALLTTIGSMALTLSKICKRD